MKKMICMLIAAALACMLCLTASAKATFTAANGTAIVDGVRDDCYGSRRAVSSPVEKGSGYATGEACAAWDDEYIYVYVEVKDSTKSVNTSSSYNSDSVEIYLDFNRNTDEDALLSNSGAAAQMRFQRGAKKNAAITGWGGGQEGSFYSKVQKPGQIEYVVKEASGGYVLEAKIPHYNYPKSTIGFSVQINDDTNKDNIRNFTVFPAGSDMSKQSDSFNFTSLLDNLSLTGRSDSGRTQPVKDIEPVQTVTPVQSTAPTNPDPEPAASTAPQEESSEAVSSQEDAASSEAGVVSEVVSTVSDPAAGAVSSDTASIAPEENGQGAPIGLIVGIIIAVLVIGGGVAAFLILRGKKNGDKPDADVDTQDEQPTESYDAPEDFTDDTVENDNADEESKK